MTEIAPPQTFALEALSAHKTSINIENIPSDQVVEELDLVDSNRSLLHSISGSYWAKINGGRMIMEARNESVTQTPRGGSINIYDFDDCLMSATGWHQKEATLLENDTKLEEMGISITTGEAKKIYEASKIHVPGFAEMVERYTPQLNLILLSIFADTKKEVEKLGGDEEQVWDEFSKWRAAIDGQVQDFGERALKKYRVIPAIRRIFVDNSPGDFLYTNFVADQLGKTGKGDVRIIASRGKIEGPLGQVYKIHQSGLMRQKAGYGQGIDMAVYSNDIKKDALLTLMEVVPNIGRRHIRIFDDNPTEILPYLEVAKNLGAKNIEVIQVSHPDAKRKDLSVDAEPTLDIVEDNVRLRHYSLISLQRAIERGKESIEV